MSLGLYPNGRSAGERSRMRREAMTSIDEIAALGATAVSLVVSWQQRDVRSTALAPHRKTARDDDIVALARHAKTRGLDVMLFPMVQLEKTRPGKWRGTIAPSDIDAWWKSYERFILHYARLAHRVSARWLVVGSELGSTELWRGRWFHLIGGVERVYSGGTVYSANWDRFDKVSFWRRVDAIGVSAYFPLSRSRTATQAELTATWRTQAARLAAFAKATGKPLWITEVGYQSRDGTAVAPWDYTRKGAVDLEEQRRCFAAFAAAWSPGTLSASWVWNWFGSGGARDTGYTPRGKPAAKVLERWYRSRSRDRHTDRPQ